MFVTKEIAARLVFYAPGEIPVAICDGARRIDGTPCGLYHDEASGLVSVPGNLTDDELSRVIAADEITWALNTPTMEVLRDKLTAAQAVANGPQPEEIPTAQPVLE